jgi:hypothetical protein
MFGKTIYFQNIGKKEKYVPYPTHNYCEMTFKPDLVQQ